jgi:hypothetical protein
VLHCSAHTTCCSSSSSRLVGWGRGSSRPACLLAVLRQQRQAAGAL